jgi:hypothetical protein
MDTTLHAIYHDAHMAQQAIEQLRAIGIDQDAIRLVGAAAQATRERDHMGSYADSGEHMHGGERDHMGGYADSGEHMHGGERDRVGSFASVRSARKPTSNVVDMLQAAGLAPAEAQSYAARVDAGAVVLFVQVGPDHAAQVAEMLRTV